MDQLLAEHEPDVVILGNSLAYEGIDTGALGRALGGRTVQHLTVFASPPPTWYAVLKNRVLAGGHHPGLVVVVGTPSFFMQTTVDSAMQVEGLAQQVGPDEPVIAAKTEGRAVGRVPDRVRLRTAALRDSLIEAGRLSVLASGGLTYEAARTTAREASAAVFDAEGAVDPALRRRVVPIVEVGRHRQQRTSVALPDTYLPDLVDLAHQLGSQIVFVRAPQPPSSQARAQRHPEWIRAMVGYFNEVGAGWIDLTDLGLPESSFKDASHVNKRGRAVFTTALAERLSELGAMGEGPLAKATVPLVVSSVERRGETPPLPPLDPTRAVEEAPCLYRLPAPALKSLNYGTMANHKLLGGEPLTLLQDGQALQLVRSEKAQPEGCTGTWRHVGTDLLVSPRQAPDGVASLHLEARLDPAPFVANPAGTRRWHWLYAGTALSFHFADGGGTAARPLVARALVDVMAPRALATQESPPAWLVARDMQGRELGRQAFSAPPAAAPGILAAELAVSAASGPFDVELVADADMPAATVAALGMGDAADALTWLIGTDDRNVSARILGGQRFAPEIEGPRPQLAARATVEAAGGLTDVGRILLPALSGVSDSSVYAATGKPKCSPLMVTEDGEPLDGHHRCAELRTDTADRGAWCHDGKRVLLRARDGSAPADNGHTYSVELDPAQACGGARWLYPGQVMSRTVGRRELSALRLGADTLVVDVHAMPGATRAPGSIHLRLLDNGDVALDADVRPDQLDGQPLRLPLSSTVTRATRKLELRLEAAADAPISLVNLALLQRSSAPSDDRAIADATASTSETPASTGRSVR